MNPVESIVLRYWSLVIDGYWPAGRGPHTKGPSERTAAAWMGDRLINCAMALVLHEELTVPFDARGEIMAEALSNAHFAKVVDWKNWTTPPEGVRHRGTMVEAAITHHYRAEGMEGLRVVARYLIDQSEAYSRARYPRFRPKEYVGVDPQYLTSKSRVLPSPP